MANVRTLVECYVISRDLYRQNQANLQKVIGQLHQQLQKEYSQELKKINALAHTAAARARSALVEKIVLEKPESIIALLKRKMDSLRAAIKLHEENMQTYEQELIADSAKFWQTKPNPQAIANYIAPMVKQIPDVLKSVMDAL